MGEGLVSDGDIPSLTSAHLLLSDDVLVPTDRAEAQQVGLLLGHPVAELPQADQQRAPVLARVLQSRPGHKVLSNVKIFETVFFAPPNEM